MNMNTVTHVGTATKMPAARQSAAQTTQQDFVFSPLSGGDGSDVAAMVLANGVAAAKPNTADGSGSQSGKVDDAKTDDAAGQTDAAAGWLALLAGVPPPPSTPTASVTMPVAGEAAAAAPVAALRGDLRLPGADAAVAAKAPPADDLPESATLATGLTPASVETPSLASASAGLGALAGMPAGSAAHKPDEEAGALAGGKDFQSFNAWLQKADAMAAAAPAPAPAASPTASATPVTVTIPTPVNHSGWGEALGHHVLWSVNQGVQQVQIQLHPTELGPISVHLRVEQDQAQVAFSAAHAHTREAIEQALPRLREMFAQEGIMLGQANVQAQTQTPQQHHGGHAGGDGRASHPQGAFANTRGSEAGSGVTVMPVRQRNGLVDDYV